MEYERSGIKISCILVDTGRTWAEELRFSGVFLSKLLLNVPNFPSFPSEVGVDGAESVPVFSVPVVEIEIGGRLLSVISRFESLTRFLDRVSGDSLLRFTAGDFESEELSSILRKKSLRAAKIFLWHATHLLSGPEPATIRQSAKIGFFSKLPISSLKFVGLLLLFSSAFLWKMSMAPSPIHFFDTGYGRVTIIALRYRSIINSLIPLTSLLVSTTFFVISNGFCFSLELADSVGITHNE
mmetsp:Transcript_12928/g.24712  ORF Transcript_12928/g.24712 Transcript_12928/m.24712 type:complete len:240 (+) Transcript_12928:584-1303(+)